MSVITEDIYIEDLRKFKKLGKDFFQLNPNKKFDPVKESQKFHKLFSLKLPEEFSEMFLTTENLSLYLLDYYKFYFQSNPEKYPSKENVRSTILRWVYSKSLQEKESAVFYLLKLAKMSKLDDFDLLLILSHLVHERRGEIYDDIITKKLEDFEALEISDPFLNYFLIFLKALYAFSKREWEEALIHFDSLENNSEKKINAYFYKLLSLLNLNRLDEAEELALKISEYDVKRLENAIDSFSGSGFKFFLSNSFTEELFQFDKTTQISSVYEALVEDSQNMNKRIGVIGKLLKTLNEKKWDEYKNEDIVKKLNYISIILDEYHESKFYIFLSSLKTIESNTLVLVNDVKQNVINKFEEMIAEKLTSYNEKIDYLIQARSELENEKGMTDEKEKANLNKAIHEFEHRSKRSLEYLEFSLEKLEENSSKDSSDGIRNSVTYNAVFSFFILLTGGFAEYSNSYVADIANFSSVLSIVLFGGFKWGAISFLIGLIISAFLYVSSYYERFAKKNEILKRIDQLNVEKEKGLVSLRKASEERKKLQITKLENQLKQVEADLEEINENKEAERERLLKASEEEFNDLTKPLDKLLGAE